jgi:hypothetical protein
MVASVLGDVGVTVLEPGFELPSRLDIMRRHSLKFRRTERISVVRPPSVRRHAMRKKR